MQASDWRNKNLCFLLEEWDCRWVEAELQNDHQLERHNLPYPTIHHDFFGGVCLILRHVNIAGKPTINRVDHDRSISSKHAGSEGSEVHFLQQVSLILGGNLSNRFLHGLCTPSTLLV